MNTNIIYITEAARKLNRSVKTLQRWDRDKVLEAFRSRTGRRYYTERQLKEFTAPLGAAPAPTKIIAYCRVSSQAQKPDLKNQRVALETYCNAKGYNNVEYVEEIGGGMNFKRKHLREMLKHVHSGDVSKIIIAHKDRLVRFGFEHICWQCEQFGCSIEVLNNETLSPEQEMVQDLMTIVHCFSSRLYGLRNYSKTLKKALKE